MNEYTPSTMSIRDVWSFARATTGDGINHEQARAEFDQWLTALDAEIRNAALEDAAVIVRNNFGRSWVAWGTLGHLATAIRAAKDGAQ